MEKNRQHRPYRPYRLLLLPLLFGFGLAGTALAAEEDVSQNDPPRWYQGDDTPKLHYQNLLKEARAAQAEALVECKSLKGKQAKACRKEAAQNYKGDQARAKRILDLLNNK